MSTDTKDCVAKIEERAANDYLAIWRSKNLLPASSQACRDCRDPQKCIDVGCCAMGEARR